MTDYSDVVDRADSLMRSENHSTGGNSAPSSGRRRRSFLATAHAGTEQTTVPLPLIEEEDIPVLTEVVSIETALSETQLIEGHSEHFEETQIAILASDIAHAINLQMAYELPTLIEATLLNASAELRAGITSTVDTALRDFIARRRQLRLPLDEPGNGKPETQE